MKEKEVFEDPRITTYERSELQMDTAFTGGGSGGNDLPDGKGK
jgi:hypothetical protein